MTIGQQIVADFTDPFVLGAFMVLVTLHLLAAGVLRGAARFAGSVALATLLAHGLKLVVGDPRPADAAVSAWGSGWPSAHAAVGVAAALALWFAVEPRVTGRGPRALLVVTLVIWALILAASRLYLGVHDLGDVASGLAVGLIVGWLLRPRR